MVPFISFYILGRVQENGSLILMAVGEDFNFHTFQLQTQFTLVIKSLSKEICVLAHQRLQGVCSLYFSCPLWNYIFIFKYLHQKCSLLYDFFISCLWTNRDPFQSRTMKKDYGLNQSEITISGDYRSIFMIALHV